MKIVDRRTVVTAAGLAPLVACTHHRDGHTKGPRKPDPVPPDPKPGDPGADPVGAELVSTRTGWGYGTYRCAVETTFDSVGPSLVWGGMFTYDPEQVYPQGHNELDSGEISAWGVVGRVPRLIGGYWVDGPRNVVSHDVELPGDLRHFVFEMVWEPGAITWTTWGGTSAADTAIASSSVRPTDVPVPADERVHFNIWVTALHDSDPA
nr:hypothetical protein [Actinomycetota bacterium]